MSADEVLTIRRRLASGELGTLDFGRTEPLQPNLMSSAVARQTVGWGAKEKYHSVASIAATLFYGLVLNHAFENGNKRTALVSLLVILERNKKLLIDVTEEDLYDLATRVADHRFNIPIGRERDPDSEVEGIATWLDLHTRSLVRGDRAMLFTELRIQLIEQGCEFDKHDQNYIKIQRETTEGRLTVRTGYPRANFTVGVGEVKRIRRSLRLDEQHGVDSGTFYDDLEAVVDHFVNTHRQVLDRLAGV